jgi:hypothetical protein
MLLDIVLQYHILNHIYICYDSKYGIRYDIITSALLRSAATLGRAGHGSGLAVLLPSLCCLGPARADTLAPYPLSLCCDGHHLGAASAVVPHPDVHLVDSTAVAQVPLCDGRGTSKTTIVLDTMWNSGVTVPANETLNDGGAPQHVCNRTDVEAEQELVAGRDIEHGHSSLLHDAVWSQINGLKRAEVHEGRLLVGSTEPGPLVTCGTQGTVQEELSMCIPHQAVLSMCIPHQASSVHSY